MSSISDCNIVRMLDCYSVEKGKVNHHSIQELHTNIVMEYMPSTLLGLFRQHRKDKTIMTELDRQIYCFQLFKGFSYLHVTSLLSVEFEYMSP
jgi:serine/threonine protein kinase